jgi:selenocysteine lyase/cysteine desulfurase
VEAVSTYLEGIAKKGFLTEVADIKKIAENMKTILSKLLNCMPDELCLIHNTAEGMNFFSHGIHLDQGDQIILMENEYPSNVYPWLHWKEKGVEVLTAPIQETPEAFLDHLQALITERTRLIAISAVHWCTGMPIPLIGIGHLCQDKQIHFVVDGAQGVGMQPIDVKAKGISFMAFSAWKWLMGPLGLGVLYIPLEMIKKVHPIFIGTSSVIDDQEYLPYKSELKTGADRFAISTANYTGWVYFHSALQYLEHIGFDVVRERIFELSNYLVKGLKQIGLPPLCENFSDHPTGIVVCEKPGTSSKNMVKALREKGIIGAERLGRIRLSPHVYNSIDQVDQVVEVLSQL